jgi:hypothetical protein
MLKWLFSKCHPYEPPIFIQEYEAKYCTTCAVIHALPSCPTCGADLFQEDLSNLMPWNREGRNAS